MAVKIRLSRIGKTHAPFFRVVAVDSRKKRDGAFLDNLGTYDPIKGVLVKFHIDKIQEWISKGAIPTDTVKRLMKKYRKEQGATPENKPKKVAKVAKDVTKEPEKTTEK